MKQAIRDSLDNLLKISQDLSKKLSDPEITKDIDKLTKLNKEFSDIKDVVENWSRYQELEKSLIDLEAMLKDDENGNLKHEVNVYIGGKEGENVYLGKDHTLHAKVDGIVTFKKKSNNKSFVSIEPAKA